MPIEEALEETKKEVERKIKFALLDRGMTQKQLSDLINENRQQVNRLLKVILLLNQKKFAIRSISFST